MPTMMHIRWVPLSGHFGGKAGRITVRPRFPPRLDGFYLLANGPFTFLGGVSVWMFHNGRARHPGPGMMYFSPGQLSIEFVNVGGWLTCVGFGVGFLCSVPGGC